MQKQEMVKRNFFFDKKKNEKKFEINYKCNFIQIVK